jgi:hypothetical protein
MEISQLLTTYKIQQRNRKTERGELLLSFLTELNSERAKDLSPLSLQKLAFQLKGKSLQDLYILRSLCYDSKNRTGYFSKCFWYSLKHERDNRKS